MKKNFSFESFECVRENGCGMIFEEGKYEDHECEDFIEEEESNEGDKIDYIYEMLRK